MARKARRVLFLAVVMVAFFPVLGRAFTISGEGEESLRFGGYFENWTGIGTYHGSRTMPSDGKVIMFRNTFLPEFTWNFGKGTTLFASARFVKDGPYAWENRLRRVKRFSPRPLNPDGRQDACTKFVLDTTNPGGPCTGPLPDDFYDETDFNAFELVLDQKPTDRLSLRVGKQFIVWGETDVFRMLDLVNPQNSAFSPPSLMPLEETRIPIWAARLQYTLPPGRDTVIDAFFAPGFDDVTKVTIPGVDPFGAPSTTINKFTGRTDSGISPGTGRFAIHPETRINNFFGMFTDPAIFSPVIPSPAGPPAFRNSSDILIPSVRSVDPPANIADAYRLGTRMFKTIGRFTVGLGYLYTYNPVSAERVFHLKSCKPGPGLSPTELATLCDTNTRKTFRPDLTPGDDFGNLKLQDTRFLDLELVADRTSIFALYFNTAIDAIDSAVRGEFSYWPNKPYNIGRFDDPVPLAGEKKSIKYSIKHPSQFTTKNTVKYAVGIDRATFIPFLQPSDPFRAFEMSFQVFQNIVVDSITEGSGPTKETLRESAHATKIEKVSTTFTTRISTGYVNNTYVPTLTLAYDPRGYGLFNFDLGYTPQWNEKIRLDWVVLQFMGRDKFGGLGLFEEKDGVFFRFRYQL